MSYATEHAGALTDITEAGAAVTFTKTTQGSYDPEADTMTASTSSVAGQAMRVRGDPEQYSQLGLTPDVAVTLLFAPTTYGETPEAGSTVTWDGVIHTVRDVQPVAPDGSTIIARVVAVR